MKKRKALPSGKQLSNLLYRLARTKYRRPRSKALPVAAFRRTLARTFKIKLSQEYAYALVEFTRLHSMGDLFLQCFHDDALFDYLLNFDLSTRGPDDLRADLLGMGIRISESDAKKIVAQLADAQMHKWLAGIRDCANSLKVPTQASTGEGGDPPGQPVAMSYTQKGTKGPWEP
jgi:hypothetical protein